MSDFLRPTDVPEPTPADELQPAASFPSGAAEPEPIPAGDLQSAVIAADDTGMIRSVQISVQTEIGNELGAER